MARSKSLPPATEVVVSDPPPSIRTMQMAAYTSPFPPADVLAGYDGYREGTAERIMKMCEGEATHRHQHDDDNGIVHRDFIKAQIFATKLAAITTAIVGIGGIIATIILAATGHGPFAAALGGSEFASAAVFAILRRPKAPQAPKTIDGG